MRRPGPRLRSLPLVVPWLAAVPGTLAAQGRSEPRFEDVTERTGIRFRHVCGSPEKDFIWEVNGSGVALFDADGDADLDIYLVNGSRLDLSPGAPRPRDALYRNAGRWRFEDVTDAAGVGDEGWGCGTAVADVENDGDLDLYVTNWGPNTLYLGKGDGTFAVARDSGAEDPRMSTSASFADFNRDGLVDLYVANYVTIDPRTAHRRGDPACTYKGVPIFCGPGGLDPAGDGLYLGVGGGRFRDAAAEWGLGEVKAAYALGTLALDVDRDGWIDLVVANDTQPNYCFLNEGGRRFREAGVYLGLAYNDHGIAQAGMGLAAGDTRGTGRDDIFVTNFEDDTNTLHLAEPGGLFLEGTFPAGLGSDSYSYLGWGTFFFDPDLDGDLDLFIANGHVAPQADRMRSSIGYRQKSQLYLNDGTGRYRLAGGAGPALERMRPGRGAACGDLDGDGDPDIVINNIDEAPSVLENAGSSARHWLAVRLRGGPSNRAAVGARVSVLAAGRRQHRTVHAGSSYASQLELEARFGLGDASSVDAIVVDWPSGRTETFLGGPVDRTVALVEGGGREGSARERAPEARSR